jgi:hypothetical protein
VSAPPIASSVATPRADPRKPTGLPAATLEAIEQADSVEVFYLDPEGSFDPKPVDTRAKFHDYPIIEKGKLKPSRAALVAAIQMGIKRFNGSFARRFNPRHGVRAVYRGVTHDLVICFECRRIMINGDPTPLIGVDEASASGFDDVFSRSGLKKKAAVRP